jgi:hypothetical protein
MDINTDACTESGGICYMTGPNTECKLTEDINQHNNLLSGRYTWDLMADDSGGKWSISGELKDKVNTQIDGLSSAGATDFGCFRGFESPLSSSCLPTDPQLNPSIGDLTVDYTVSDGSLTLSAGASAMWQVRSKTEKYQIGVEKVYQEGKGTGDGRGGGRPFTYRPVFATATECYFALGPAAVVRGVYRWDKNWETEVSVRSDFSQSIMMAEQSVSAGNLRAFAGYEWVQSCVRQNGMWVMGLSIRW